MKTQYDLVSSTFWPANMTVDGLLSNDPVDNPAFYAYNKVFVGYCSSDTFVGTALPGSNSIGWYFAGNQILLSLLDDLATNHQLGRARNLVLTGCSAGGQAVVLNSDWLRDAVLNLAPSLAQFVAIADAAWLMDETPYKAVIPPLRVQLRQALALWGALASLNASCVQANSGSPHMCLFSPTAIQYVRTPTLIQTEQYDSYQTAYNLGHGPPIAPGAETNFVNGLRSDFQTSLRNAAGQSAVNAFFSPACYAHCLSLSPQFWTIRARSSTAPNYVSFRDVISQWWTSSSSFTPVRVIDDCVGWNCSENCPNSTNADMLLL